MVCVAPWWLAAVQVINNICQWLGDWRNWKINVQVKLNLLRDDFYQSRYINYYHTVVYSSVNIPSAFDFNKLFDHVKMGWKVLIDSWDWLLIGRACVLTGPHHRGSIPWLLLSLLAPNMQDGSVHIPPSFWLPTWILEEVEMHRSLCSVNEFDPRHIGNTSLKYPLHKSLMWCDQDYAPWGMSRQGWTMAAAVIG